MSKRYKATIFAGDFGDHPSEELIWVEDWLDKFLLVSPILKIFLAVRFDLVDFFKWDPWR